MPVTPPAQKPDRFRLQPNWILLAICTAAFVSGAYGFLYLDSGKYILRLLLGLIYLSLIPRFMWGFELDQKHFTILLLFFPVRKVPWEDVAQVLLIQRKIKYKSTTIPYEYLCVTLKPAEPLPFFYENELGRHKRRNILLVWNLCLLKPERIRCNCIQAFQKYWMPVETRKFHYTEPE